MHVFDPISTISGIVQTGVYIGFFIKQACSGKHLELVDPENLVVGDVDRVQEKVTVTIDVTEK